MIKFKTDRIQEEWDNLRGKNPPLYDVINCLNIFVYTEFGKDLTLTGILRTQEEQEAIYGAGTTKKSVHQFWGGVDIRSYTFSDREIERMLEFLNCFRYKQGQRSVAMCHDVGQGKHFHIQYWGHEHE